ncbi:MAG TPA: PH domain-containing protein [Rhodanobacteraceae bacterium]|nr:PH domain-containing protein [Rhodanobacteraceae bacterium]
MSYLQKSLAPGEAVVAVFRLHWIAWIRLSLVIILGIIAVAALLIAGTRWAQWGALAAAVIAILIAGYQWLWLRGIEQAVTTRRVVRKVGIVSRTTTELRLASIETVDLHQSVWGRILGFGDVEITGRGETAMTLHRISRPIAVKRDIETAYSSHVETSHAGTTA